MLTAKERIEAARAARAKIEARLTPEKMAEIQEREEAEREEARTAELAARERAHLLATATEALKVKHGPHLRPVDLETGHEGHGTWILRPPGKDEIAQFQKDTQGPAASASEALRRLAEACVIYWNGAEEDAIDGEKMHALFDEFGAIPMTLGNNAIDLGGFVAVVRKSSG